MSLFTAITSGSLMETFQSRPILHALRSRLMADLQAWVDEYNERMAKAKDTLRRSQTANLKKHFGKFDDPKNAKKLEKMYNTYIRKKDDALFTWSIMRLPNTLLDSISTVLKDFHYDYPIQYQMMGRQSVSGETRASITPTGNGLRLSIYVRSKDWEEILRGDKSLEDVVNEITSDIIHEMVHHNQFRIDAKHGNEPWDRGLAVNKRRMKKDYKKALNKYKNGTGSMKLTTLGYFTTNHEVEAYATNIAVEVIDGAKKLGISPYDYLKHHAPYENRSIRNYLEVKKDHPEVWNKLIRRVVSQIKHLTEEE